MRMTFDQDIPVDEQLKRATGRKKKGRKHNHCIGPTRKKAPGKDIFSKKSFAKYKKEVRAYWDGERDTHPNGI